jgi:L-fuconolactonase
MAALAIVDAHVHFWDPSKLRYPWLDDIPLLNRSYLPADYREAASGIPVARAVFVQAECDPGQALDEVRLISDFAAADPFIAGIVAYAPLELGEAAAPHLEALRAFPLVRGIRRIIQFERDPGFCLRPDFIAGVRLLAKYGFTFDLCVSHGQMPNMIRFVEQCPGVRFILDHIGKPDIKNHVLDPWRSDIRRLASLPNVLCKISGLVTEADHAGWTVSDLEPYIRHVVECFGFGRVAYGGDWPVALLAARYPAWIGALRTILSEASDIELDALFRANASAFYSL